MADEPKLTVYVSRKREAFDVGRGYVESRGVIVASGGTRAEALAAARAKLGLAEPRFVEGG